LPQIDQLSMVPTPQATGYERGFAFDGEQCADVHVMRRPSRASTDMV
jgi:hypothetical protein